MKKRKFYVCLKCGWRFLEDSKNFKNNIKNGRHLWDNGKIEPLKDIVNRHDTVFSILALANKKRSG